MVHPLQGPKPIGSSTSAVQKQRLQAKLAKALQRNIQQVAAKKAYKAECASGFNPVAVTRKFKTLEEQRTKGKDKLDHPEKEEIPEAIEAAQATDDAGYRYQQKNPELLQKSLETLKEAIDEKTPQEKVLKTVLDFYPDCSLADEALDYLIETSSGDVQKKCKQAKEDINASNGREIKAGRNIGEMARSFSKAGLGSPTALRDLYREITGNPRSPQALFEELSDNFDFKILTVVISFLLHSLGKDLKSKGPSIEPQALQRLMEDTKALQAILGVYRFFKGRMGLITSLFDKNDLAFPQQITFDELAKKFMSLLSERYISADKVLRLSLSLGISEDILAKIIIFMQMRDAIRQISPRLYKNLKQKEDLLSAVMDALEELEEEEEEGYEDEDENEDRE